MRPVDKASTCTVGLLTQRSSLFIYSIDRLDREICESRKRLMLAPRPHFTLLLRVSRMGLIFPGSTFSIMLTHLFFGYDPFFLNSNQNLPAFPGATHLLPTVCLRNYTEQLPSVCFSNLSYAKAPRQNRRRRRNQPACCGGAAFLFHNKTWTIIPTIGSLRVYVHPWSGTVYPTNLVAVTRIRASVSTPP